MVAKKKRGLTLYKEYGSHRLRERLPKNTYPVIHLVEVRTDNINQSWTIVGWGRGGDLLGRGKTRGNFLESSPRSVPCVGICPKSHIVHLRFLHSVVCKTYLK